MIDNDVERGERVRLQRSLRREAEKLEDEVDAIRYRLREIDEELEEYDNRPKPEDHPDTVFERLKREYGFSQPTYGKFRDIGSVLQSSGKLNQSANVTGVSKASKNRT